MSWGAVIGAAAGLVGTAMSNRGASRGADAASQAQLAAIDEQRRQYDQTREDMMPWLTAGRGALGRLEGLLANPDSIQNSAAYQWRFNQGLQGLDRSAAARGNLFSGGHHADVLGYGQGMASQEYTDQWNRLAGLAGVGQTTASSLGTFGANAASNVGNALGNIGQARQSMYQQQGQNYANLAYGLGGLANNWIQNRRAGG